MKKWFWITFRARATESDPEPEFNRRRDRPYRAAQSPGPVHVVERFTHADEPPPMARMLRGGRGGQVRLKLSFTDVGLSQ
ncbi:hypothetical protein ACIGBH_40865 [Streptomyces sp. NPDC085929]|uniref:hypothetical protein n=1 Tax=Streptomyces sp. NPDC085929 TaxID=3365739 RepID=UPI0037D85DB2